MVVSVQLTDFYWIFIAEYSCLWVVLLNLLQFYMNGKSERPISLYPWLWVLVKYTYNTYNGSWSLQASAPIKYNLIGHKYHGHYFHAEDLIAWIIINQEAFIWTYWHGCRVEPVRNLVVSDPCLTCRTARSFTTLALARHIAHSTTPCQMFHIYQPSSQDISLCLRRAR